MAIISHLVLRYGTHAPLRVALSPLVVALLVGGTPLVFDLAKRLVKREFGSDLLAGVSILTAVALGQYLVGAIVVLMLSGGTALEKYATARASSVLDALARRMPSIAHLRTADGAEDVKLEEIRIGDVLIVLPHEICPVDGIVIEGRGRMDEAYLTGEPYEISKMAGSQVISGAINSDAALVIRAEKLAVDSRYARIMKVMQSTEQERPPLRRLGDQLGAWYTPVALILALIAALVSRDVHRFLAVVVVATPCPLSTGDPDGDHRGDFGSGAAGDYHQESGGAGANRFLPDADLRQDRHADVRDDQRLRKSSAPKDLKAKMCSDWQPVWNTFQSIH